MEELKSQELEGLVQELEAESLEEEALSPEVELLLGYLEQAKLGTTRLRAAERLGKLRESSPRIVQSLIAAAESDSSLGVSEAAVASLRAPAHQKLLQEYPDLVQRAQSAAEQAATQREEQAAAAESALQQDLDLRQMARGAPAQRRTYPKLRIQERHLVVRILGGLFALIGLVVLVGSAVGLSGGINLAVLVGVFGGLSATNVGLYWVGLDPKELFLALLHRGAWQGQQVTADGRITDRDIEEHKHEDDYGGVSYTYTHWITFGFPTAEGQVRLKVQVNKRQYGQLKRGQPVKVRYAQEDPRLALLEWESGW